MDDGNRREVVGDAVTKIWAARNHDAALPLGLALVVVYFSFHAGGYFPGITGLVAALLCLLVVARIATVERPFGTLSRGFVIGAGALALFALWTLFSGTWSDAPSRALVEYDRVLLYVAGFMLFGALGRTRGRMRWMVRLLAATAFVVCLCGLMTRLFPDVWSLPAAVANERLNYPLTYWNALGLLAALGTVLCFALTADLREKPLGRVLAAGALPVLGVTLLLTFSRGSIAAAAVGVVAMIVVGRPRALPSAIVVAVPTVLVAVAAGYSADLLASDRPASDAAASQGHVVAIVVLLCVVAALAARRALLKLDLRLMRVKLPEQLRRPQVVWGARAGALVAVLFALFVWPVNLPDQYDAFVNGDRVDTADLRSRLGTSGDNGRIEHWRAALVGFKDQPLSGTGAGTYALQWDLVGRSDKLQLQDAHSLYIEVLGELGLIGLLLVLTAIGCVLAGFFARARDKDSVVGAALFGAGITWALAAGTDWHWEMPAVTFWFFAAGGLALASIPTAGAAGSRFVPASLAKPVRWAIGIGCLLLAIAPARMYLSDGRLRDGVRAFDRGDCATTIDRALASKAALGGRPEPYLLLAYCDVRFNRATLAVAAMSNAVRRDPHNWEVHYGLALVRAAAGLDPRPEARTARRLNPREATIADTLRLFDTNNPQQWRARAGSARLPTS